MLRHFHSLGLETIDGAPRHGSTIALAKQQQQQKQKQRKHTKTERERPQKQEKNKSLLCEREYSPIWRRGASGAIFPCPRSVPGVPRDPRVRESPWPKPREGKGEKKGEEIRAPFARQKPRGRQNNQNGDCLPASQAAFVCSPFASAKASFFLSLARASTSSFPFPTHP